MPEAFLPSTPTQEPVASNNIGPALKCLGYSSKNVVTDANKPIKYPDDPFDHYQAIHKRLEAWDLHHIPFHTNADYSGPWVENVWAMHFQPSADSLNNTSFYNMFGPYIPLFIPWTDIWVQKPFGKYPKALYEGLKEVLRHDVIYITVSQNDDGLPGDTDLFQQLQNEYNIVIMSAGGYGHVPIPLLKQPEEVQAKIPMSKRTHLVSYVGGKFHAPNDMRRKMISIIGDDHYYKGKKWRSIMQDSKFSLCPRGFGRSSYHVMETLQMGLIPIQVYVDGDIPWLPYQSTILKNISFSTSLENLPTLITKLEQMPDSQIEKMELAIERLIKNYFTFDGVMVQIQRFLLDYENSDLICHELPNSPGSNREKWFPPAK
eukprot:CAMPEP_0178768458 /NCGR_PEP_ID=MMETSP0744-20121128/20255_1 /TAXON_ID=913974 /ORGANISM="Nitzschia punctata, Strain CCMP561" /LENGTH=373 /DNA_ID=CAMNT_0020424541 /DNA_START=206 /DNA_END=1327 /DNA_ORIENTATION=+